MSALNSYFIPGDGIAREVIFRDLGRYLGPDATARPGVGDSGNYVGVSGYWVKAHQNLTSEMIAKLKVDTEQWRKEVGAVAYTPSSFYDPRRSHWGPPTSVAQPNST
ncbi:hypothetical protein BCR34DRAFT_591966 [Clohesyomyces aquaticus]|uniref:Uncharacterized protein n=1 Tax=Clohesyomyces aquaticus TaxID=1231657 RepID=A0A1Y1YX72_9PLEO|nr:hypothetical protein BCR34DRAFT_591966 [Clohesyomyces aquaticus]